jgi:polysaccharide export outer membrane protein
MKFVRTIFLLGLPIYLISCSTQKKLPNYIENAADSNIVREVKIPELKIQKNDLLSIQVYSESTKPQVSDIIYNLPTLAGAGGQAAPTTGFLIDVNGNIEYPRIGTLHVEGLTKLQLADLIRKKINEKDTVLINPSVIIRFLNYRVTVLGEVGRTGSISVPGERITILEALGLAGGISDYGKKNEVKVVREIDGKRETGIIDLSSKDLFESPYYNLMQNDYVFVYPTERKAKTVDQSIVAQRISLALSVITAAAFIYNIFK